MSASQEYCAVFRERHPLNRRYQTICSFYRAEGLDLPREWWTISAFEAWAARHGLEPGWRMSPADPSGIVSPSNYRITEPKSKWVRRCIAAGRGPRLGSSALVKGN